MPDNQATRKVTSTKRGAAIVLVIVLGALLFIAGGLVLLQRNPPAETLSPLEAMTVVYQDPEEGVSDLAVVLQNSGFELGFHNQDDVGELKIADGWQAWYTEGSGFHRPEYGAELLTVGSGRGYAGAKSQKQFTTFARQDGGIYQRLSGFEPGRLYEFSAWVYIWSSDENNPDKSEKNGGYSAMVGVNPWGNCWPVNRTTIWGKEKFAYDRWEYVSVTIEAWSEDLCFFTRGVQEWPVHHGDSYWDATSIREVTDPGGGKPCPTAAPYPTAEGCPTANPWPTVLPGAGVDYNMIRTIVREEINQREPIRWPR